MSDHRLGELRGQIDAVDRELLALFERRMALCREVGVYKKARGMQVLDAGREAQVLEARAAWVADESLRGAARAFFQSMMAISRGQQQALMDQAAAGVVAYQGVPGAYGHQALIQHFGAGVRMLSGERFEDVFRMVRDGQAELGVAPIENSSSGTIAEVYDLLGRYGLWIVGEERVHVRHMLLGQPGAKLSDIRRVYSHEQGFLQCTRFLDAQADLQRIPCFNTAIAAQRVAQGGDPQEVAIASRLAGETYGLEALAEDIHNFESNHTRFVVISRTRREQGSKASLTFILRHQRGTLHRALASFVALGLSLTRIESRPIADAPFEYRFYVDVEGLLSSQRLAVLQEVLAEDCASCDLLGVYEPAEDRDA